MGCCLPCDDSYEEIKDENWGKDVQSVQKSSNPLLQTEESDSPEFDLTSHVFQGSTVDQKFSNKATYEQKFVWINLNSKTLNLSEYKTKEKRHKEASIRDIVNVVAGPPNRFKAEVDERSGEQQKLNIGCCLSVTFVRGGGIDLKFKTEAERDAWYLALTKMMASQRFSESPRVVTPNGNNGNGGKL
jgi:hypothetical protein